MEKPHTATELDGEIAEAEDITLPLSASDGLPFVSSSINFQFFVAVVAYCVQVNPFMHPRRSQKVNSLQSFDVKGPTIRLSKSIMSQLAIQIFHGTLSLLGINLGLTEPAEISWGSVSYLELIPEDVRVAQNEVNKPHVRLGQWVFSMV